MTFSSLRCYRGATILCQQWLFAAMLCIGYFNTALQAQAPNPNPCNLSFTPIPFSNASGFGSFPIISGQNYRINGVFTVDVHTYFINCNFLMGPNASIVITGSASVSAYTTTFAGCSNSWDGIKISGGFYFNDCLFRDANEAVQFQTGYSLQNPYYQGFWNCQFRNNRIGISSYGNRTGTIINNLGPMTFGGNIFSAGDYFSAGNFQVLQEPYAGVFQENTLAQQLGDINGGMNIFSNLIYGIHLRRSTARIGNCRFEGKYDPNISYPYAGSGIYSYASWLDVPAWRNSKNGSSALQYTQAEVEWQRQLVGNKVEMDKLLTLNARHQALSQSLAVLAIRLLDSTKRTPALLKEFQSMTLEVNSITADLTKLQDKLLSEQARKAELFEKSIIDKLPGELPHEQARKILMKTAIKIAKGDSLTKKDHEDLMRIAGSCPSENGDAVQDARIYLPPNLAILFPALENRKDKCVSERDNEKDHHHHVSPINWQISPNPASDYLVIQGADGQYITKWSVFNVSGQLVKSGTPDTQAWPLQVSVGELGNGLYILQCTLSDGSVQAQLFDIQQ
jgi:Secretion system C-terminal sorting domain